MSAPQWRSADICIDVRCGNVCQDQHFGDGSRSYASDAAALHERLDVLERT